MSVRSAVSAALTRLSLVLALIGVALSVVGRAAGAAPSRQAIAPPPAGQRFEYLGQTGGVVHDFAIRDDLVFVPEGDALTILQLHGEGESATVLSRISPNQGKIRGIALAGETAFLITPIGLAAVDVRNPGHPEVLSFLPGGGEVVQVAGQFAFVAARAAGVRIINVSDPYLPVLASTLPVPGKALAIALDVTANLAYVAADEGGVRVIDVSAPDVPREVASMELPAGVQQLKLQGEMLYLSSGDRILLVDVSRPGTLVRLSEYAPPRQARRASINGNYAYVADVDGGLKVFDVSDVEHPLLVYAETEGTAYDVTVQGNRAYVADGPAGIRILDVSNPRLPRSIAQLSLPGVAQGLELWDDALLVAAGEAGLLTLSLANERAPAVLSQLDTDGVARDVKAGEHLAYVADGPAGLAIISLARRESPELRGLLYIPGEAQALGLWSTFVYVAADDGGLQIIDAIRPAAPFLVGGLSLPEGQRAVDIALVNKRAYLAVHGDRPDDTGLAIADVGFRDQPVILSRVPGPGAGVAVRGVEPLTVGGRELMTVDARASSGPVLRGHYRPPFGAGGMDWDAGTLYLTSGGEGPELTLLDVGDSAHPRERLHMGLTAGGGAVRCVDRRVYLAAGRRGLRRIEIEPWPPGTGETAPGMERSTASEQVVYDPMDTLLRLAAWPDEPERVYGAGDIGWSITDVRNPSLPQPLSRVQTDAPVHGMARLDDRLYVALAGRGLQIYDSSDATQPLLLGQWPVGTAVRDVLVRDGFLYVADRQAGLHVLNPEPPGNPSLLQTLPLPGKPERIVPLATSCTDGIRCNLAYVLTGEAGLRLVDLGHPTAGAIPLGKFQADVVAIAVSWPYAYTLDGGTFAVWEFLPVSESGPAGADEPLASFPINGEVLLLSADRAFVGSEAGHVSIVDVRHPAEPRVLGMMVNAGAVRGLALSGDHLITGLESFPNANESPDSPAAGRLRIWNVEDPVRPQGVGLLETPSSFAALVQPALGASEQPAAPGRGQRMVTAGESLTVFDVVPTSAGSVTLTVAADIALPVPALSLYVEGDLAYVGTESGLLVVSGMEVNVPRILGELPLDHAVLSVVAHGERAYLAINGVGGLLIDLSDPAFPRRIANLPSPTGGPARGLTLVGDHMWAMWEGWVSWLDIGRPRPGPSELGAFEPVGFTFTDLTVVGDRAYLTDAEAGLLVLDVSDPLAPTTLGSFDTPGQAHAVAVAADGLMAYIADGECGVRAVTLDDPTGPAEIGFWHTGFALDVTVLGDKVYVADIGELAVLEFDPAGEPSLPPLPQSPQPADGAMFYPLVQDAGSRPEAILTWGPPQSRCDPLTYDLYLGTESPPPLAASGLLSSTFRAENLERRQTYFWRVVAHDLQGDEAAGPVWRFHLRTSAQPPPSPTPALPPELPPVGWGDVLPVIGGLAAAGALAGIAWWARGRGRL